VKAALVLLALGLAGCAMQAPAPVAAPASVPMPGTASSRASADELLGYLARLRAMNEAQLAAEAARQRRAAASDLGRVKAALALTMAHHPEDGDIAALVEPVARREAADPNARAMAGFLLVMAAERRRLRESAAAAGARLKDERRAQEAMKQKAEAAAERAAQLQQKLDALTEIERSLSDRQVPNR
jgi:hypothetical protein